MLLEILMQYSSIISHLLSPLERRFRDIQIVIITKFVVVWRVGIKRVHCTERVWGLIDIYIYIKTKKKNKKKNRMLVWLAEGFSENKLRNYTSKRQADLGLTN